MLSEIYKNTTLKNTDVSASCKWIGEEHLPHWHEFYEIEYVISGTGTYMLNGQSVPMKRGMLFFMTPTDFHSVSAKNAQIINVMFRERIAVPAHLLPFTYHAAPNIFEIPTEMQDFFLLLLQELVANQKQQAYTASLLDCLLLKLATYIPSLKEDSWNSTAQKIHFYIVNHFRSHMSLEDAAQYVNLTPTYVSAVFKKEMGKGLKEYLDELRFAYAEKLLLYSDMSVMQVCWESGFEDYPNFIRRFKRYFGMTPTQMRRKRNTAR